MVVVHIERYEWDNLNGKCLAVDRWGNKLEEGMYVDDKMDGEWVFYHWKQPEDRVIYSVHLLFMRCD
jgi:hypothetical protein